MANDKEKRIKDFMRIHNVTRAEAEFMFAVENGEIEGDVVELDSDETEAEDES